MQKSLFLIKSNKKAHKDITGKHFYFEFVSAENDGAIWRINDERYPEDQPKKFHSKHLVFQGFA